MLPTEVVESLSVFVIATIIWIQFSLSDMLTFPNTHRHTQSLAGGVRRGCSGLPYHFKHPSAQQRYHISCSSAYGADRMTNERVRGRGNAPHSPFIRRRSYMAVFHPLRFPFAPSISLSRLFSLLNWITAAGRVCAHVVEV